MIWERCGAKNKMIIKISDAWGFYAITLWGKSVSLTYSIPELKTITLISSTEKESWKEFKSLTALRASNNFDLYPFILIHSLQYSA